jgi:adenosylcobyric acid synthase
VAPFKAQNMSLNSYVTAEGHEIGRAQVVQAEAAGIAPHVDMNPVLLKPEGAGKSQVVVMGKPWQSLVPADYYERKQILWEAVTGALARLRSRYDLVIIEGAGSPAEINLRDSDIVNMAVARHAKAPVLLVGDIDRGGVFASLVGTLVLLEEEERHLVKGLVINKFRGDLRLLNSGLEMLEERAGVPVLGVIHFLHQLKIAEEDSVALDSPLEGAPGDGETDIAVIRLPRISNFDDFDALALEPNVRLRYVDRIGSLGHPVAVILPGTKHTLADLAWLRAQGLDRRIVDLARQGAAVVGICGGYQMLGTRVSDPLGVEAEPGEEQAGLDLLPLCTEFAPAKTTHQAAGTVLGGRGFSGAVTAPVKGYEIHMGHSTLEGEEVRPLLRWNHREGLDGAIDSSGRIWGSYLHGIFDNLDFRRAWLQSLGWSPPDQLLDMGTLRQAEYDRLAATVRASLDMNRLRQIVGIPGGTA